MEDNKMNEGQTEIEILERYWKKWTQWMEEVRKQRYQAVRLLQYQNELQEKRLRQCFKLWQQVLLQEKIQKLNRLKNSVMQEKDHSNDQNFSNDDDCDQQLYNLGLAIKYHQKKTYSKSIRSWIDYGITSKKFQKKLSMFYIRFLLKKYFYVINDYRMHSKNKKLKKAQTFCDNSLEKVQQSQFDQSKINAVRTEQNFIQIEKKFNITNQIPKIISEKSNFTAQRQIQQNLQSNSLLNFQRNHAMGQSRRSDFSTVSAINMNYQSKRKFRPIMELPSIPDIEKIPTRQTGVNKQEDQRYEQKSAMKFYESQAQSQTAPYNVNRGPNLAESKVSQIQQEDKIKQKFIQLLLKEKLITLAIISGQQFKQPMQYQNYRQKTICSLQKIKQLKII